MDDARPCPVPPAPQPGEPLEGAALLRSVAPGHDAVLDAALAELGTSGRATDPLAAGAALRAAGIAPERAAAALSQAELRERARIKLGDRVDAMLLTRAGVEQATRWQVAALHAAVLRAAGVEQVTDVGCGLGADTHALAAAGLNVTGIEADEQTAAAAAHNLAGLGRVVHDEADATLARPEGVDPARWGLWFDPARRTGVADATGRARRVSSPQDLRPSLDLVTTLAQRAALTGCKVGPGWRHADIPPGAHAQWVSHAGDLVEAVLWMGPVLRPQDDPAPVSPTVPRAGTRSATRLGTDGSVLAHADSSQLPAEGHRVLGSQDEPGTFLVEPDPALSQAGLLGVALGPGDAELGPGVGWGTSDSPAGSAWTRTHRIVELLAPRPKAIRQWARRTEVGELVVRKHGSTVDPATVRKGVRTTGTRRAILLLTRVGDRQLALEIAPPILSA